MILSRQTELKHSMAVKDQSEQVTLTNKFLPMDPNTLADRSTCKFQRLNKRSQNDFSPVKRKRTKVTLIRRTIRP